MTSDCSIRSGCWALLGTVILTTVACSGDTVGANNQNNSQPAICGNGVVDGVEFCDGADLDGASCVNLGFGGGLLACGADCNIDTSGCEALPVCGDGVVDFGEECDDGNALGCDGCSVTCRVEACGDGVVECGEVCDDGNTVDGDGCSADCRSDETCLNGVLDPLTTESCDDGNGVEWDGCNAVCECVEFQVNTYATDVQYAPRIARAADGSFVVVWLSDDQDGSGYGIYAQRFGVNGNPIGMEFLVNTYITGEQLAPSISMAADGRFVVAWQSQDQDGSGYGVYAQRYGSGGTPLGSEFQVNTSTHGTQNVVTVAMADDGSFVIAYSDDPADYDIKARLFDAGGVASADDFQVNTYGTGNQSMSKVAMTPTGEFVIVWHSELQDGDGWGVFGQRFAAGGATVGGEFQVSSTSAGDQRRPDVALADDGSFMAIWSDGSLVTDTWDVLGRRFDIDGIALGPAFQINAFTSTTNIYPHVDMVGDGRSVVTWQSPGNDGDDTGAYARYFGANGVALGPEFLLNLYTAGYQSRPVPALNGDGSAWIFWDSEDQDGSLKGIFGRRFDSSGVGLCRGL